MQKGHDHARCYGLVPCAGVGARAGQPCPKQYVEIAGRSVVAHTLAALAAVRRLQLTLVAVAPDDDAFERRVAWPAGGRFAVARCGGPTRADTVFAGLAALRELGAGAGDWVLVHDAARCLVRGASIEALIAACEGDAVGGLLAVPVADTLKRARAGDGRVDATIPRDGLWQAQTPQMFRLGVLEEALRAAAAAGREVTDEASAIEGLGLAPKLVRGRADNVKLTHFDDFALAERLLAGSAAAPGPEVERC